MDRELALRAAHIAALVSSEKDFIVSWSKTPDAVAQYVVSILTSPDAVGAQSSKNLAMHFCNMVYAIANNEDLPGDFVVHMRRRKQYDACFSCLPKTNPDGTWVPVARHVPTAMEQMDERLSDADAWKEANLVLLSLDGSTPREEIGEYESTVFDELTSG